MPKRLTNRTRPVLDTRAPYWNGERCETIVRKRIATYPKKKKRATKTTKR